MNLLSYLGGKTESIRAPRNFSFLTVLVAAFILQGPAPPEILVGQTQKAGPGGPAGPGTFLSQHLAFSRGDLEMLETGQAIVKLPKTAETREVASFTIARIDVPNDFFVEQIRDIVKFKKTDKVLQIGKFSNPPRLEDLSGLTLERGDIEAIKGCRVKRCDLKFSGKFIEKLQAEMDWSAPNSDHQVTRMVRAMLLEHVQAYLKGGNAALGSYEDKSYSLSLAEETRALLKPVSYMYGYLPELQRYIEGFPTANAATGARTEDFVYWSKEDLGLKPVISVTHVTIYRSSHDSSADVLITSKGIYASHYLEASLGLTAFIGSNASQPPRSYLIYVNRSRTDALRGLFAGLKRSLIAGRLRTGARTNMGIIKQKLEAGYTGKTAGMSQ